MWSESPTPCFSLKSGLNVPIGQLTSPYQEERNVLVPRDEELKPREFYKTELVKWLLSSFGLPTHFIFLQLFLIVYKLYKLTYKHLGLVT